MFKIENSNVKEWAKILNEGESVYELAKNESLI